MILTDIDTKFDRKLQKRKRLYSFVQGAGKAEFINFVPNSESTVTHRGLISNADSLFDTACGDIAVIGGAVQ